VERGNVTICSLRGVPKRGGVGLYLKRDALNSGLSDVVCVYVKGFSYACLVSLRTVVDSVGGDGRKYVVAGQAVLGVAEENLKFVFDTLPTMR
jgi:hypothetical protein